MKFNDKEKFIGAGILVIILGLSISLYVFNLPDNSNLSINQEDVSTSSSDSLIGNVINNLKLNKDEIKNFCGDGFCDSNEDCSTCSSDCGECLKANLCGNKFCDLGECNSCPSDCSLSECENNICESAKGENCQNTPNDCKCKSNEKCNFSNGLCELTTCGNLICDNGENSITCPNDCKETYKEVLYDPDKDYPIIFVHGHSPTEVKGYQPTELEEFQDKLEEEGYQDMGFILPSDYPSKLQKGIWSGKKISVLTTYYANKYDHLGGVVGPDDNQHIDVYSQRLADVVEVVKHNTGKNKVIIISHSMGGLVSRNYIKNYGGLDSVDKLIMMGTPNHGTYGYIAFGCNKYIPIFHERQYTLECEDMDSESGFIGKLNEGDETSGDIKYLTIIGINTNYDSCPYPKSWDNVICTSSVYLDGAENYYYTKKDLPKGERLHTFMVHPSKAPEVYNKIVSFINS